jgi:peptidoglycan/LPS O-acetylase OafA/YrhL
LSPDPVYRPDINGLRALALLDFVLHHIYAPHVLGSYVSADVFFVISGNLITGIISGEMVQGTFIFTRIYERRS